MTPRGKLGQQVGQLLSQTRRPLVMTCLKAGREGSMDSDTGSLLAEVMPGQSEAVIAIAKPSRTGQAIHGKVYVCVHRHTCTHTKRERVAECQSK